ncbi:MAG: AI-2E family transporter [Methanospirillum sp.]|nr:AI-2E family transporter [Methanospirillum sp.]
MASSDTGGAQRKILRTIVIIAGGVVILAGVKGAAPVVGPLLVALFISVLLGMLMRWLETRGVPHWLAVTIAIGVFFAVIAGFILLIAASFIELVAQIPAYQESVEETLETTFLGIGVPLPSLSDLLSAFSDYSIRLLSGLITGITTLGLIIITTLFFLVEADSFVARIGGMLRGDPDVLERLSSLARMVIEYMVLRTEVNLMTGVGTGLLIAGVGGAYAVFWGFLAFSLSYIPYLGFWLAVIPPILIAWAELGPIPALIILVGAAIVDWVAENILFPQVAGKGLDQSPAVVFVSLMLWSYVLGGVGALLAVPLTLSLLTVLQCFEETRWISELLSPRGFVQPLEGGGDPGDGPPGHDSPDGPGVR